MGVISETGKGKRVWNKPKKSTNQTKVQTRAQLLVNKLVHDGCVRTYAQQRPPHQHLVLFLNEERNYE